MIGLWTRTSHDENEGATDRETTPSCSPSTQRMTLEYAPAARSNRGRIWFKRVTLTIFFTAASAFAVVVVKQGASHWSQYRRQQAEASYQMPREHVAWTRQKGNQGGIVFQHRRVRPDGTPRIVQVQVNNEGLHRLTAFQYRSKPLRSIWGIRSDLVVHYGWLSGWSVVDTLFAGQPDAQDESHFTMSYECDRQRGTIDGWLMNDDTVKLEVRDGPLRDK